VKSEEATHRKADTGNPKEVGAPMPGKVFKILVNVGDEVRAGDTLLSTEAMKMETNIKAKEDGKVVDIFFKEGAQVQQGDLLVILE
jgi:pyruvate carboxylase